MNEKDMAKYAKMYEELMRKHDQLTRRYAELEKMEEDLNNNTSISNEERLERLGYISDEYTKVADEMGKITEEAKKLAALIGD